eukprot:IDg10595t1
MLPRLNPGSWDCLLAPTVGTTGESGRDIQGALVHSNIQIPPFLTPRPRQGCKQLLVENVAQPVLKIDVHEGMRLWEGTSLNLSIRLRLFAPPRSFFVAGPSDPEDFS